MRRVFTESVEPRRSFRSARVRSIWTESTVNIVVFGSFGKRVLPRGWTKETTIALLGSGEFDLSGVEPGGNRA